MSLSGSLRQMREDFEAQFEVTREGDYLYRRNQKGEPIPVTADERERFTHQYVWRIRFIIAGMFVALFVFFGVILWRIVATNADFPEAFSYVGIAAITVLAIAMMYWARAAPARELDRRMPVGRERSNHEMRAIFFRKMSYGQLAGAAAAGLVLVLSQAFQKDLLSGWNRMWLLFAAGIILAAAIQAFRKWRIESNNPDNASH